MFIPEKTQFMEEASKFKKEIQDGLFELYDHLLGVKKIKNSNKAVKVILSQIFSNQYSSETNIPLKFLDTAVGRVLFTIIYGMEERLYTVNDIIEMTKNKTNRPNGVSRAWMAKEIKNKSIQGAFQNGRWVFTESAVDDYFKMRGYLDEK